MCYCPTPTLHLNLALTGDGAFLLSPQKTHSVWFISILNYGDTENVLINHLLLVIPMSYPCHYTNLCPHKPHKHAHTHTQTKPPCVYFFLFFSMFHWNTTTKLTTTIKYNHFDHLKFNQISCALPVWHISLQEQSADNDWYIKYITNNWQQKNVLLENNALISMWER